MIRVIFKDLEKSEFAKDLVLERMESVIEKFPELNVHKMSATLSMENSPHQAGPDHFTVKLFIDGKRYKSIVIEKSAASMYVALADVVEHALERLNRYGDKVRVKTRKQTRKPKLGSFSQEGEEYVSANG